MKIFMAIQAGDPLPAYSQFIKALKGLPTPPNVYLIGERGYEWHLSIGEHIDGIGKLPRELRAVMGEEEHEECPRNSDS